MQHVGFAYRPYDKWEGWRKGTFNSGPGSDYLGHYLYCPKDRREAVNLTEYQLIGWVNTDSCVHIRNGRPVTHVIYETHEQAGPDSRPAYITRETTDMKHIGHMDGATTDKAWRTHSLGMIAPHDLFIPDPGERENVSADQWILAGWVIPDKDGGTVYAHHRDASEDGDARPAYVRRPDPDRVEIQEDGTYRVLPVRIDPGTISERDPKDVRRSEFDSVRKDLTDLMKVVADLTRPVPDMNASRIQAEQPMTFYDHAYVAAYMDLRSAEYDDITHMQRAHTIAAKLTRNRAVPS
jgi:hypothetical protein